MKRTLCAMLAGLALLLSGGARPAAAYDESELEQLVGPVALYPDDLLSNVLAAATYPDEVTQADNWTHTYGPPPPPAVDSALANVDWDPSVKSLTAFPEVLDYLADNMSWTTALGNAFITQPDDVYNAVQTLRQIAEQNGSLVSNSSVTVVNEDGAIVLESPNPADLCVPSYNPGPVFFGYSGYPTVVWGAPVPVLSYLWFGVPDWQHHHIYFGRGYNAYYGGVGHASLPLYASVRRAVQSHTGLWQFNPQHRGSVAIPAVTQPPPGRGFSVGGPPTPRGPAPDAPGLFNVRPGGEVNIERSEGARSRNTTVPRTVRPVERPVYRPSPPTHHVPTPHASQPHEDKQR